MKKRLSLILAVLLLVSLAAGCAAGYKSETSVGYDNGYSGTTSAPGDYKEDLIVEDSAAAEDSMFTETENGAIVGSGSNLSASAEKSIDWAEKIIYTANIDIETLKFDESVEKIYAIVGNYGGFMENSSVSGRTYDEAYYGYKSYRRAEFTLRIPVEAYSEVTSAEMLTTIGNVTNKYEGTDNITTQFYDTQSRLDTYKIEEERLLAMLEKAETVTDMIEIESRISQVRYNIESLQSQLKNWQNEVDYSTVYIYLREVGELTEIVDNDRSYWEEVWDGLKNAVEDIGDFFKEFFKNAIIAIPSIIIILIFAAIVFVIVRAIFGKKAREKRSAKKENKISAEADSSDNENEE